MFGKHLREVLGAATYDLIKPHVERTLQGEQTTFTAVAPYKDGGNRLVRATYVPDRRRDGHVDGFFALIEDLSDLQRTQEELREARDNLAHQVEARTAQLQEANAKLTREITDRERAERALAEKERVFSELVETAPSLVVLTDADGRILLFNRACETLTGHNREEVIGRSLIDLFIPDEWQATVRARFADGDPAALRKPHENPWRTGSGQQRLVEWRCATLPLAGHDRPGMLGIGVDITERKEMEQLARQQQAELAHLLRVNTLGEMATALALSSTSRLRQSSVILRDVSAPWGRGGTTPGSCWNPWTRLRHRRFGRARSSTTSAGSSAGTRRLARGSTSTALSTKRRV
jgi:PAS domain S-box-containing protein